MSADWKSVEDPIAKIREDRCKETLQSLLGGSLEHQPKVGVCLSGGGWRAMSSACALFDALSTPLDASETFSGSEGVKLFDTVSYACGLSGGSWSLFTTLAGGYRNPFHTSSGANDANGASTNSESLMNTINPSCSEEHKRNHPWIFGRSNNFDPAKHQYDGLKAMLNKEVVNRACYRGTARKRFVYVTSKVGADTTFGAALATKTLGETLVGRWANFLANDILHFLDGGNKEVEVPEVEPPTTNEPLVDEERAVEVAKELASLDPNLDNPSRDVKLGDLKALIETGDFPFVVCSAIANRDKSKGGRLYDWVEFSPYFLRSHAEGFFTTDVDNVTGYFAPVEKENGDGRPMRVHHFMAVCGSAFACDISAVLPSSVSKTLKNHVEISNDPIIGRGVTDMVLADNTNFGVCRDAGIDFNIPLPPMLPEHQREFDIIIVMDAGAASTNAFELWKAVDLGYLELITPPDSALTKFPKGSRVKVYRGLKGHPSIIYLLGLTDRPTSQIIYSSKDIISDVDEARNIAPQQLVPVLISELRIAKARLEGKLVEEKVQQVTFKKTAVSMTTRRNTEEDDDEESPAVAPTNPNNSNFDAIKGFSMNDVASSIVLNAAANNRLHDTIDSFAYIEKAVLSSMPAAKRIAILKTLEAHALDAVFGLPSGNLKEELVAASSDALQMLLELGIVTQEPKPSLFGNASVQSVSVRSSSINEDAEPTVTGSFINSSFLKGSDGRMQVDDSWVDYFAVMALVPNFTADIPQRDIVLQAVNRGDTAHVCTKERWDKSRLVNIDRPWGRFSLLLGSLQSHIYRSTNVDLSTLVANFAAIRLEDHFKMASTCYSVATHSHEFTRMVWTQRDEHEEHLTLYARHLADMYSEALSPTANQAPSPFDLKALKGFYHFISVILQGSWDQANTNKAISPVNQVLLIVEVLISHPHDNLLFLIRSLFVPGADPNGVEGIIVRISNRTTPTQNGLCDLGRLHVATYQASNPAKKAEVLKWLARLGMTQPKYQNALKGCMGPVIRYILETQQDGWRMDSIEDVRTILSATHHNAVCLDGRMKREAMLMLWKFGSSSLQFQQALAKECFSRGYYWPFLSSCSRVVSLSKPMVSSTVAASPSGLPGYDRSTQTAEGELEVVVAGRVLVERILLFAESCRKSNSPVKVEIDQGIAHDTKLLCQAQRDRIDRINSQIAHVAHRVAETAVAVGGKLVEKGLGVKSAAVGLVGGFFSKKDKK